MLVKGKYILPIINPPSKEEKLNILVKLGFPVYHLFGPLYLGRNHPYKIAKFSTWRIIFLK